VWKHGKDLGDMDQSIRDMLEEVDVKVLKVASILGATGTDAHTLIEWNTILTFDSVPFGALSSHADAAATPPAPPFGGGLGLLYLVCITWSALTWACNFTICSSPVGVMPSCDFH
jgi:hypothetical protein